MNACLGLYVLFQADTEKIKVWPQPQFFKKAMFHILRFIKCPRIHGRRNHILRARFQFDNNDQQYM